MAHQMERQKQAKSLPQGETCHEEALQAEIAGRNFVRAAMLAQKFQRPQPEVRHLQESALRQMACEYRNAIGTRKLAQEWGFSRADLENLLLGALEEYESKSDKIRSQQCYDASTGEYFTLRQWIEKFLKPK